MLLINENILTSVTRKIKPKITNKSDSLIFDYNQTFQSGLSKPFSRAGVIFPLTSSRGRPSSPPAETDDVVSVARTVFFGTAETP